MPSLRKVTRVLVLNIAEAAYIAGVLDSEGTVIEYNKKGNKYPAVLIYNSDLSLLEWIKEKIGCGSIVKRKTDLTKYKQKYRYQLHSKIDVYTLLSQLAPYLRIKNIPLSSNGRTKVFET